MSPSIQIDRGLFAVLPQHIRLGVQGACPPWAFALLGRLEIDAYPELWIETHEHMVPLAQTDPGSRASCASPRRFQPPLVEAITEVADELAVAAPLRAGGLPTGAAVYAELLGNAIGHRDYSVGGPIRVHIHPDGLRIVSPGHLPQGVYLRDGRLVGKHWRNVEAMAAWASLRPTWATVHGVAAVVRCARDLGYQVTWYADESVVAELRVDHNLRRVEPTARRREPRHVLGERIALHLRTFGVRTAKEISDALDIPGSSVRAALRDLQLAGRVRPFAEAARSPKQAYVLVDGAGLYEEPDESVAPPPHSKAPPAPNVDEPVGRQPSEPLAVDDGDGEVGDLVDLNEWRSRSRLGGEEDGDDDVER